MSELANGLPFKLSSNKKVYNGAFKDFNIELEVFSSCKEIHVEMSRSREKLSYYCTPQDLTAIARILIDVAKFAEAEQKVINANI